MADEFLKELEQDAKEKFAEEAFEIDTSKYSERMSERWRIQPLPAGARDKVIRAAQESGTYTAVATALVYQAYKADGHGRRFNPGQVQELLKNPDFLEWISEQIDFMGTFGWMLDMSVADEKKPSEAVTGSGS